MNKIILTILYLSFFQIVKAQNCSCGENNNYDTSLFNNNKITKCGRYCLIMADKISLLYKLADFNGNICDINVNNNNYGWLQQTSNYLKAKNDFLHYIQYPFVMNFDTNYYLNDSILIYKKIKVQRIIIHTTEYFDTNAIMQTITFGKSQFLKYDTIYIGTYDGSMYNPIFLSSWLINTNIYNELSQEDHFIIFKTKEVGKKQYKEFLNYYYKLLKIRNISFTTEKSSKNTEIIRIRYLNKIYNIMLNKNNIQELIKNLIAGGKFEYMIQLHRPLQSIVPD